MRLRRGSSDNSSSSDEESGMAKKRNGLSRDGTLKSSAKLKNMFELKVRKNSKD